MTTRLLLLPADAGSDATWLETAPPDRITRSARLRPGERAPTPDGAGRTWAVVPTSGLGLMWTALPVRQHAPALAAARLALDDHAASPAEALHVAVSPYAGAAPRLVAWADPSVVHGWLARARAHGIEPAALVPDVLLLAHDGAREQPVVVAHDGRWLVRGDGMAFSAEPALARQLLDDTAADTVPGDFIDACARGAALDAPPLDLMQGAFAVRARRGSDGGWRRAAVLAGALLLSPWLLLAAEALQHELASRQLQARAQAVAARVAPAAPGASPLDTTATRLAALQGVDALARDAGALFQALEAAPGAHLDGLQYAADDGLRARIVHPRDADLDAITAVLAGHGLALQRTGREDAGGAIRSDIAVGPGA